MKSNLYIKFAALICLISTAHSSSPQNSDNDLDDIFKQNPSSLETLHSDGEDVDNNATLSGSYIKSNPVLIAKNKDGYDGINASSLPFFIGSPKKAERAESNVLSSLERGPPSGRTSPFKAEKPQRKSSVTFALEESKVKPSSPTAATSKPASILKKPQTSFSDPDISSLRKRSPSPDVAPFSPHLDVLLPLLQQIILRDKQISEYTYLVLHKTNRGHYPGNLNPDLIPENIRQKSLPEILSELAQQLQDREQDKAYQSAVKAIQDCLQSIKN